MSQHWIDEFQWIFGRQSHIHIDLLSLSISLHLLLQRRILSSLGHLLNHAQSLPFDLILQSLVLDFDKIFGLLLVLLKHLVLRIDMARVEIIIFGASVPIKLFQDALKLIVVVISLSQELLLLGSHGLSSLVQLLWGQLWLIWGVVLRLVTERLISFNDRSIGWDIVDINILIRREISDFVWHKVMNFCFLIRVLEVWLRIFKVFWLSDRAQVTVFIEWSRLNISIFPTVSLTNFGVS